MVAAAGRLVGARQRGADHHGVGAAGDRLRDVAAGAHASVGDHVAVAAGLVLVLAAGGRRVGDRRGLRDADAEHAARGARVAGAHAHQHADGAGAHQVKRRRVRGASTHDHGQVEVRDELLEVQGLGLGGDVLGADDRALDHQDVELGVEHQLLVLLDPLGRERGAGDHRSPSLISRIRRPISSSLTGSL